MSRHLFFILLLLATAVYPIAISDNTRDELFPEMENTDIVEQFVSLPNGIRLSYAEQGNPAGVPVILLHGWTDSWHSFYRALPFIPDSLHILAPSLRGHGDSDRPSTGYNPEDFAADLLLYMNALDIESAIIAGFSMGSIVAQKFAIQNPERTAGLVLIGTPTNLKGKEGIAELWDVIRSLEDPIDPEFIRKFNAGVPVQPVPARFLDIINRENMKVPARVWKEAFRGVKDASFSAEYHRITVPALILWGDRETFTTLNEQHSLEAAIPRAELKTYAGHGHALHWESPERFAADLTEFVLSIVK